MILKKSIKIIFFSFLLLFFFSCKTVDIKNVEADNTIENTVVPVPSETSIPDADNDKQSETPVPGETSVPSKPLQEQNSSQLILSRKLTGTGLLTATQLADYFISQRPDFDYINIVHFAQLYIVEASVEGINSDVAFAQMCLETGYLKFGGLVQPEFHNYCGLGAMDEENPGCIFENEQMGVRAHIQHLQAYATTEDIPLNNELIDPRYNWVHKTKYVETIEGLAGTWAADPNYAKKIEQILQKMEALFSNLL